MAHKPLSYQAQVAAIWSGSVTTPQLKKNETLVPINHYALYKRLLTHPDPHPLAFKLLTTRLRAASDEIKLGEMQALYDSVVRVDEQVSKDTALRLGQFEEQLQSLGYLEDDELMEPNEWYGHGDDEFEEYGHGEDEEEDYYSSALLAHNRGHHHRDEDKDEERYGSTSSVVENALRERRDATEDIMPLYIRGAETKEQLLQIATHTQASPQARLTQLLATRFAASSTAKLEDCDCCECGEDDFVEEEQAMAQEFLRISPQGAGKVLVNTKPARRYRSRDGKAMVREYEVDTKTLLAAVPLTMRTDAKDGRELHVHCSGTQKDGPLYSAQDEVVDRPNIVFRYGPDGKELTHVYVVTKYGDNWFTRTWRGLTNTKRSPDAMFTYPDSSLDVDVKRPLLETLARDRSGSSLRGSFDPRFSRSETRTVGLVEFEGRIPHRLFTSETQVMLRRPALGGSLNDLAAYMIEEIDLTLARAKNIMKSQLLSWNQSKERELYLGRQLELEVGDETIPLRPQIHEDYPSAESLRSNVWYSHGSQDRTRPAVIFHFATAAEDEEEEGYGNDRLTHIYLVRRAQDISDAYGGEEDGLGLSKLKEWVKTALTNPQIMAKLNDAIITLAQETTTLTPAGIKKRVNCGRVLAGFLAATASMPAAANSKAKSWIEIARPGSLKQPVVAGPRITGLPSLATKKDIEQLASCLEQLGANTMSMKTTTCNELLQQSLGPLLESDPTRAAALISSIAHACTSAAGGHRWGGDRILQLWDAQSPLETFAALKLFEHA
jgi:hypothetical protein